MQQEPAQELDCTESQPAGHFAGGVVPDSERDLVSTEAQKPLVGDRDPMGVTACESPDPYDHFQAIEWINQAPGNPLDGRAWMCGQSGWFLSEDGSSARDTDWFVAFASVDGVMEFTVESEYPMYMYKLVVQDCATVEVDHSAIAECGATTTLAFPVLAGEEIWLWTGPTTFEGPVPEFSYFMTVSNVYSGGCIPIEAMSWGQVKSLYR